MFILTVFGPRGGRANRFNDVKNLAETAANIAGNGGVQATVSTVAAWMSFGDKFTYKNLFEIECIDDKAAAGMDRRKNKDKLDLSENDLKTAVREIDDLRAQLGFLSGLIGSDECTVGIVDTHMRLLRSSHDVLAGLFRVDPLSEALKESNRLCREANARISELKSKLAAGVTVDAALAKLAQCENWFRVWFKLTGWKWIRTEWTPAGILFSTSDEVRYAPVRPETVRSDNNLPVKKIKDAVPYAFSDFDLYRDTFHGTILDTQKNRDAVRALFVNTFPGAHVSKFESYEDEGHMTLRAEGLVPWDGVRAWRDRVLAVRPDNDGDDDGIGTLDENTVLVAYDINWDTDDDQDALASLPTEMTVPRPLTNFNSISDWLTESTGFCHFGFKLRKDSRPDTAKQPGNSGVYNVSVPPDLAGHMIEDLGGCVSTDYYVIAKGREDPEKTVAVSLSEYIQGLNPDDWFYTLHMTDNVIGQDDENDCAIFSTNGHTIESLEKLINEIAEDLRKS